MIELKDIVKADVPSCESLPTDRKKVVILGSGPNRIGQGIEFDYTCVHAAFAMKEAGVEAIMVNCNPETVSTDYDTSDRLYFEPLTGEDVVEVIKKEQENGELIGVNVQFGGQTPLGLAKFLQDANIPIIGTSPDMIDLAEDRDRFKKLLQDLKLNQPDNHICYSMDEVVGQVENIGFPVVIRPSYVLGGRGMAIVHDKDYLMKYLNDSKEVFETGPLLLDKFLTDAVEVDVDALCDGKDVFVAGIMQHIEEAGVHSGDSACYIPHYSLSDKVVKEIKEATEKPALALNVKGLMNIQFAVKDEVVYLLEVNPRASRTVPFVAKATGVPIAKIASLIMIGKKLKEFDLKEKKLDHYCVKEAVFPFARFNKSDIILGPEMKSTGEAMGVGETFGEAYYKAQLGGGSQAPRGGKAILSVKDSDKAKVAETAKALIECGFEILATGGTATTLVQEGVFCQRINKVYEGRPHLVDMIKNDEIDYIVNTTEGKQAVADSFQIRRSALQYKVAYTTTLAGGLATAQAIRHETRQKVVSVQELHKRVK